MTYTGIDFSAVEAHQLARHYDASTLPAVTTDGIHVSEIGNDLQLRVCFWNEYFKARIRCGFEHAYLIERPRL